MHKIVFVLYAVWILALSLITFVLYGWDKRQARNNGRRIPEQRLHSLCLFGGWPGAIAGQRYFRHKTQKFGFRMMNWLAAIVHVVLIAGYWYLFCRTVN